MSKLNKHGIPMHGIKPACSLTRWARGAGHVQVSYDLVTGQVYADWLTQTGEIKQYQNPNVVTAILRYTSPVTMQTMADDVYTAVCDRQYYAWELYGSPSAKLWLEAHPGAKQWLRAHTNPVDYFSGLYDN